LPQLALQVALAKNNEAQVGSVPAKAPTTRVAAKPEIEPAKPTAPVVSSPENQESKTIKALSVIKHYNNSLYAVLRGAKLEIKGSKILILCRFSFHRERLNELRNKELIEKAFSKVFGTSLVATIEVEGAPSKQASVDPESELVSSAMAILGGELVEGEE
jgi:hypothetical protein